MVPKKMLFALVCAFILAGSAGAQLTMKLEMRPSAILPGTSANTRVVITNSGASDLLVRNSLSMQSTDPAGQSFFAVDQSATDSPEGIGIPTAFTESMVRTVTGMVVIPAGTSVLVEIPFNYPSGFFYDRRLSTQGQHKLRMRIESSDGTEIWSDEAILAVREPSGIDLQVWDRMTALSGGFGWAWMDWRRGEFVEEVWSKFRESGYAVYAVGPDQMGATDWAARRELGLSGPQHDYILLKEVDSLLLAYLRAAEAGNHSAAKKAVDDANSILKQILSKSDDAFAMAVARTTHDELPTASEIQDAVRVLSTKSSQSENRRKVVPVVECVEATTPGMWRAVFGYTSEWEHELWLGTETGQNKFEPKPHKRGQPETFSQGIHAKVFSVTFDGEPITWFIRGEKATASRDTNRPCQ